MSLDVQKFRFMMTTKKVPALTFLFFFRNHHQGRNRDQDLEPDSYATFESGIFKAIELFNIKTDNCHMNPGIRQILFENKKWKHFTMTFKKFKCTCRSWNWLILPNLFAFKHYLPNLNFVRGQNRFNLVVDYEILNNPMIKTLTWTRNNSWNTLDQLMVVKYR